MKNLLDFLSDFDNQIFIFLLSVILSLFTLIGYSSHLKHVENMEKIKHPSNVGQNDKNIPVNNDDSHM